MKTHTPLVGLLLDQEPNFVVAMLGALNANLGFVPLSPTLPELRLLQMVEACNARTIITSRKHEEVARSMAAQSSVIRHIVLLDDWIEPGPQVETEPGTEADYTLHRECDLGRRKIDAVADPVPVDPDSIAYVVFTSGTTGRPKGVPITHRKVMPLMLWQRKPFKLGTATRTLQTLPFSFDFGIQEILNTTLFGGAMVFLKREQLIDPAAYVAMIHKHDITMIYSTPSFFDEVVGFGSRLESLQVIQLGGEAFGRKNLENLAHLVSDECTIFNGYGPTETSINCLVHEAPHTVNWRDETPSVPIGRPSGNNRTYILDTWMNLVPIGVIGQIYIGGEGLADGYLNDPVMTADRFIPNPHFTVPGERLYRTGDLAYYLPDWNIVFVGRSDHQVKIRGYRIELEEIQSITEMHTGVRSACVVVGDRNGEKSLVAYVVPRDDTFDVQDLRQFWNLHLPAYMLPAAIVIIEALPLTQNGKLDMRALPPPDYSSSRPGDFTLPRNHVEARICEIWKQLLGQEVISVHENFFDLGGNSLLLAKQHNMLQSELNIEFPIAALFEFPTVVSLSEFLGRAEQTDRTMAARNSAESRAQANISRLKRRSGNTK